MRVLTVRQPWAWAIIHGGKDVENRSRNLAGGYRGPVAIHAGLTAVDYDDPVWEQNEYRDAFARETSAVRHRVDERGSIIGVVDLVDVHNDEGPGPHDDPNGCCTSVWHEDGEWHLVLANPRPLTEPIPFKGGLGLRKLTPETINLIEGALS
ncbi:ASCH domain-containing protein [Pseudoclavibacter sp. AY1H1]|uniref:ASCH domain-containing protein n=1 Tax=Pseudoclavibacter sp. AY1H1 TaxID=2080584 RepID=UPI000CE80E15|nr:ASCH domain-containing protein [Pseudoclavibacter sp. AY1H1]PPF38354.1 hypothetical protein C5E05_04900 [Pseudoclavibacter sp. AY1H1]